MPARGRWTTDLVMLGVTIIWALNNVALKAALPGWVAPGAFNALRFAAGALMLCTVTLALEGSLRLPPGHLPRVALLGLIGVGVNQMLYILGLARSTAGNTSLWFALVPILVPMISTGLGVERVSLRFWMGALASAGGMFTVLAGKGGLAVGPGDLFLAGAVLTWAGYTAFARPLTQDASPIRVTAVSMLVGAAGLLAWNTPALLAQDFAAVPLVSWLGMLYAAVLSNTVGFTLYVWSVRRAGPARVALFQNVSPVLTGLGAWWLIGEVWVPLQWFGVALVMVGVVVARWDDLRHLQG